MFARCFRTTLRGSLLFLGLLLVGACDARADFDVTFFGIADSIGAIQSNSYITLQPKRVPAGDVIKIEFTNNGTVIVNADGSHFGYQGKNTANVADDTRKTYVTYMGKAVRTFNGKDITDTQSTIGGALSSNIKGGFFNPSGGGLVPLADALASAGFMNRGLDYPAFSSDLGQMTPPSLFVGAALQDWVSKGITIDPGTVGSLYQVTNGMVTSRLSGRGPDPSDLSGFFFSNSEVTAGSTSFTGSPFTGEVELSSLANVGLAAVPEPATLIPAAVGGMALAAYGWRRRERPVD